MKSKLNLLAILFALTTLTFLSCQKKQNEEIKLLLPTEVIDPGASSQNIKPVWEGITIEMPDYIKDFADVSDRWCFIGAYENNPNENIRENGAVWWAGYHNTYFTIDVKNKIALVYLSQLYPTVDKERFEFYRLFEKEVYSLVK